MSRKPSANPILFLHQGCAIATGGYESVKEGEYFSEGGITVWNLKNGACTEVLRYKNDAEGFYGLPVVRAFGNDLFYMLLMSDLSENQEEYHMEIGRIPLDSLQNEIIFSGDVDSFYSDFWVTGEKLWLASETDGKLYSMNFGGELLTEEFQTVPSARVLFGKEYIACVSYDEASKEESVFVYNYMGELLNQRKITGITDPENTIKIRFGIDESNLYVYYSSLGSTFKNRLTAYSLFDKNETVIWSE